MPNHSPPPTPVSSPRVSPTPPGSPKQVSNVDKEDDFSVSSQDLGLSPSPVPLRPVHVPDVNPTDIPSDDMDIDDDPSPALDHHGSDGQENGAAGSSSDTEPEWSPEDWMADMRRVKARLSSYLQPKHNLDPHVIGL